VTAEPDCTQPRSACNQKGNSVMRNATIYASLTAILLAAAPVAAIAGPCTDDIATIGKQLSQSPSLGPVTTGTLSGSNPAATHDQAAATPEKTGTSASNRIGGTAGTKEADAAANNVATSDADVRRQQAGHATAAAQASSGKGVETAPGSQAADSSSQDDHITRAKVAWQKAVDLNAKNDTGCRSAVAEARSALKGS
jgi:hypothetical protein